MNSIVEDIDYIIEEMDYRRLKKIEEIKEEYFYELSNSKKKSLTEIFLTVLFVILFYIFPLFYYLVENNNISILTDFLNKIDNSKIYSLFFSLWFILIVGLVIVEKEKMKKEYKIEKEEDNLNIGFFINKLKEEDLEIPKEKMKYYKIFLKRYISYFIYNADNKLNLISESYFDEKYVSFLTIEELFVSAFVFPSFYSFIYEKPSSRGD